LEETFLNQFAKDERRFFMRRRDVGIRLHHRQPLGYCIVLYVFTALTHIAVPACDLRFLTEVIRALTCPVVGVSNAEGKSENREQ
jgi:hypothetical protein